MAGRQFRFAAREIFPDLLFYHHLLRRFVIIDLKIGEFRAESVSKMNLYLSAVDEQLRLGDDRESVGIILCTGRNETAAKLALHRVYAPIAVSTWRARYVDARTTRRRDRRRRPPPSSLSELDIVRMRLIDRVSRHAPQIADTEAEHKAG